MACTRRTKTLVSTCVILSGMTNIVCLLYVGWVTNYIANIYIKVPMPLPERKLEGDKRGDTLRIMERLDRLENVVNQHIQGKAPINQFNSLVEENWAPPCSSFSNTLDFKCGLIRFSVRWTWSKPGHVEGVIEDKAECPQEDHTEAATQHVWCCLYKSWIDLLQFNK